jgi:hypothetical protein
MICHSTLGMCWKNARSLGSGLSERCVARKQPRQTPLDPDLTHYLARIDEFEDRVLKVVVNTKKTPPLVVTAFFDRGRTIP